MVAYEFYWRDVAGNEHLLGILPERRKKQERITEESIVNWGRRIVIDNSNVKDVFFTQIQIEWGETNLEMLEFLDIGSDTGGAEHKISFV